MKKYTILASMLLVTLGCVYAQDTSTTTTTTTTSSSSAADYAPAAGDISGAILFGRGNFFHSADLLLTPPSIVFDASGSVVTWTVPGNSPYNSTVDPNDNPITNIVGGEVRYFLMDNIALKLSGAAIFRNTPARVNTPALIDDGAPSAAWIPAYAAVEADNRADININLGGEYHFSSKYSRLFPYAGLTVPFYYARRSAYDPTIIDADGSSSGSNVEIVDVGFRHTEVIGFGAQAVGGVDYYLLEGLYFGFEIKPISFVYAYSNRSPAPGLEVGQAENTTFSFFTQPFFKVGFRF
jgi:outer membrane protein W